jgi:hypothetical protein
MAMKNRLLVFVGVTLFGALSAASIYDGGAYSPQKVSATVDVKPLGPDLASKSDPFSQAPVGKTMYVIGEDKKCYWGSFAKSQDKSNTVLIVYYSSPVSSEHCVYQSDFSPSPQGYSLWVKDGGKCVTSHADVEGEKYDWVVKIDEAQLQTSECFRSGVSYGDVIDKKHHKMVATAEPPVSAVREVVKSQPTVVEVAPPKLEKRTPTSVETKKAYTLQFSSHLSDSEAQDAIKGLKAKGLDAFELKAEVAGKVRYRVCSGHFSTTKSAREFYAKLPHTGSPDTAFVQVLP